MKPQTRYARSGDVHIAYQVVGDGPFERDGWACCMPHCSSRGPFHAHHVWFRSAGGPDDLWNLATACEPCHRLIHDGHVVIQGRAPDDLVFLVGVTDDGTPWEAYRNDVRLDPRAIGLASGGALPTAVNA